MFRFHNTNKIDVVGMTEQEEHSFFYYCMGVIKYYLDIRKEKGLLFDVTYYYGGCGGDGFRPSAPERDLFSSVHPMVAAS